LVNSLVGNLTYQFLKAYSTHTSIHREREVVGAKDMVPEEAVTITVTQVVDLVADVLLNKWMNQKSSVTIARRKVT